MPIKIPLQNEIIWSVHRGYGWIEQYHKMLRWYKRLNSANNTDFFGFCFCLFSGQLSSKRLDRIYRYSHQK